MFSLPFFSSVACLLTRICKQVYMCTNRSLCDVVRISNRSSILEMAIQQTIKWIGIGRLHVYVSEIQFSTRYSLSISTCTQWMRITFVFVVHS